MQYVHIVHNSVQNLFYQTFFVDKPVENVDRYAYIQEQSRICMALYMHNSDAKKAKRGKKVGANLI